MNKKLIAGIVIAAAVVCCGGGYVAMQNEKKVKQENVQISEMLDKLPDITVKEGESLPDLKNNIEDTSMIEPDTLKVDIQNVDITVPGTYDVVYSFKDICSRSLRTGSKETTQHPIYRKKQGMMMAGWSFRL